MATSTVTGPTANGQTFVVSASSGACNYSGEYNLISFVTGNFTLTSSIPTDYFTVTDISNNVLFNGIQPLTFSISTAGTYRSHVFSSSSCVADNTCRGVSLTKNGIAVTLPPVTTTAATAITATSATSGGNVTSAGSAAVTDHGVCYATTANPALINGYIASGFGTGAYVTSLPGLTPSTLYHIRAYATSTAGTSYGADLTFTTTAAATGCIATTQYPTTVVTGPTTNGQTVQVATNNYAGEYYEIILVAGTFSASSSITTDYLTVTTTTNTILF